MPSRNQTYLLTRDWRTSEPRNEVRGRMEADGLDAGGDVEEGLSRPQRQEHILKRTVGRPLNDIP